MGEKLYPVVWGIRESLGGVQAEWKIEGEVTGKKRKRGEGE